MKLDEIRALSDADLRARVTEPKADPRPVVKAMTFAPPATWPVAATGS